MSGNKRYLLDANVFIEANQKYYGFDICPGFWRSLIEQHKDKRVFSIDRVQVEIASGNDTLSNWAKDTVPKGFFKQTADQAVIDAFRDMVTWVNSEPQFNPAAKTEFARVADGWAIAYAKVNGLIVVTHEEYAPDAKRKVPIPNVCLEFNVEYVNTFEMLQELGVEFVLKTRRRSKR